MVAPHRRESGTPKAVRPSSSDCPLDPPEVFGPPVCLGHQCSPNLASSEIAELINFGKADLHDVNKMFVYVHIEYIYAL